MTRKLKILVKNGQMSMKKSLKNGRFCQIFDEKKTLRGYSICGAGLRDFQKCACGIAGRDFFLKNGAGGICGTGSRPRAALEITPRNMILRENFFWQFLLCSKRYHVSKFS